MSGYTKLIDGYWASSTKKIDDTWQPIEKEGEVITSPLGLVEQLEQEVSTQAKQEAEAVKVATLNTLTVTTESGKVFYADLESRVDLQSAIDSANLKGITETTWKLAEEFERSRIVVVTLGEVREALALALEAKDELVGVKLPQYTL